MVSNAELYTQTHRHLHILKTGANSHSPWPTGTHTQYHNFTSCLCFVYFLRFSTKKEHEKKNYFETEYKVDPTSAGKDDASAFDRIVINGDGAWVRNEWGTTGLNALLNNAVRQNEGNHEIGSNLAGTQTGHLPYGSGTIKHYSQNVSFTFWPVIIFWLMLCEIKDL
jgi:hypothetical protein